MAEPHATAFCHYDLGAERMVVDVAANAVTAIIDPVRDLALMYRGLGREIFELTPRQL